MNNLYFFHQTSWHTVENLRKPRLRRNMILAILAWTLTLTIFDGHVRNIVNLVRTAIWGPNIIKFSRFLCLTLFK